MQVKVADFRPFEMSWQQMVERFMTLPKFPLTN